MEVDPQTGKLIGLPDEWKASGLIPRSLVGDQSTQNGQNSAAAEIPRDEAAQAFSQLSPKQIRQNRTIQPQKPSKKLVSDLLERTCTM